MREKSTGKNRHRVRAEKLRTIARGIFDPKERSTLMEIADDYEKMAGEAEQNIPPPLASRAPRIKSGASSPP